jgi:hypothetical protein
MLLSLSSALLLLWESFRVASLPVQLGQALACLDQLHHVDDLLECHDGKADAGKDPGHCGVL